MAATPPAIVPTPAAAFDAMSRYSAVSPRNE